MNEQQGFLVVPAAGSGPGVLVLHAWWGLNATMKALCVWLGDAGFVAYAPDLYDGKVATTIAEAEALVGELNADEAAATAKISAAVRLLSERTDQPEGGLTVIGFSLGAYFALELANADPEHIRSVVLFYGTGGDDFSRSRARYLGHFAENDPYEPKASVDATEEAVKRAGRPVTFYRYRGVGHWFFEPDRHDAYDEAAATLAWVRTLAFLNDSSVA